MFDRSDNNDKTVYNNNNDIICVTVRARGIITSKDLSERCTFVRHFYGKGCPVLRLTLNVPTEDSKENADVREPRRKEIQELVSDKRLSQSTNSKRKRRHTIATSRASGTTTRLKQENKKIYQTRAGRNTLEIGSSSLGGLERLGDYLVNNLESQDGLGRKAGSKPFVLVVRIVLTAFVLYFASIILQLRQE